MFIRSFVGAVLLLLLAGCGTSDNRPTLADQAKTATIVYTAATKNAQNILKADLFGEKTEACIKAADTVAWGYQDELNLTAQKWLLAGAPERKPLEDAATNIEALFNAATLNLTNALTGQGVC